MASRFFLQFSSFFCSCRTIAANGLARAQQWNLSLSALLSAIRQFRLGSIAGVLKAHRQDFLPFMKDELDQVPRTLPLLRFAPTKIRSCHGKPAARDLDSVSPSKESTTTISRLAIVGASNRDRTGSSTWKELRTREMSCIAIRECPPKPKKLS